MPVPEPPRVLSGRSSGALPRAAAAACMIVALVAPVTGCAARPPAEVPLPTFEVPPAAAPVVDVQQQDGLPPCESLLPVGEVEAVLGLPLGEVTVREVRDVAAPAVGRLQRLRCTFAGAGAAGPVRGVVLELTAGRFVDAAAARAQRERNAAALSAGSGRPAELGTARGTEHASADGHELLIDHAEFTVDLRLPGPPESSRAGAVLTDLALRVLARLPVAGSRAAG